MPTPPGQFFKRASHSHALAAKKKKAMAAKRRKANDSLDESLGVRDGKEATKTQSFEDRRNESRGERSRSKSKSPVAKASPKTKAVPKAKTKAKASPKTKAVPKAKTKRKITPKIKSPEALAADAAGAEAQRLRRIAKEAAMISKTAADALKEATKEQSNIDKALAKATATATAKSKSAAKKMKSDTIPAKAKEITKDLDKAIEHLTGYKDAAEDTILHAKDGHGSYEQLKDVHKDVHSKVKKHMNSILDDIARKVKQGDKHGQTSHSPHKHSLKKPDRKKNTNPKPSIHRTYSGARGSPGKHVYGGY